MSDVDQLEQLHDRIRTTEREIHTRWHKHASVTVRATEAFKTYREAAEHAKTAANTAKITAERYRDDDTLYPDGRRRLMREAAEKGHSEVSASLKQMEVATVYLKAELTHAAVPRLDPSREMAARDELRLLLDYAPDPVAAMSDIVINRHDEVAAVACSSYGESYLRAKGIPKASEVARDMRESAALAAVKSEDPVHRAAGEALADIGSLDAALACTRHIAQGALEAAEVEA